MTMLTRRTKGGEMADANVSEAGDEPAAPADVDTWSDSALDRSTSSVTTGLDDRGMAGRRLSISLRALALSALIVGLIASLCAVTWLYFGATTKLNNDAARAAASRHAEQIALDYAVDAAVMDHTDLGPWKQNLVRDMTPELREKLTKAAIAMEQILLPLQWNSTAKPIAAKVRSEDGGVYVVDAFVSVMTKTVQAADGLQSTATYSITIDSNDGWQISDVGGISTVVADK